MNKRVLVISDMHLPYQHKDAIKFLAEIKKEFKPDRIINIGDLLDFHAISMHTHDPDLASPGHELVAARKYVKELSSYRFNICPPGNGIDTHRIWESLMVKTIPIVKKNEFTTNLVNNGVPLLELESWNNLLSYDIEHLEKIYLKLSSKFDMQKITKVSYWLN